MWNDKLLDGRDPRPIYWIVMGLFSLLLGIGWLALVAADRTPPSTRGLEFLFVLLGIGATIYGVVLVLRSRRKR
ncbi:hypothetical protein [Frigoribacterium sp. RIT-PI-h]|uniref:hypothetical protein n=1 Tax=Frigoribacterium sp. RIT-PI-h TaxID=1690245 RepID=UPI0006B93466|nr:hypothetical protein [Frigoribacterium sp. RIT-PI-h]KPG82352.1 hypothetical protein AEQ27_09560 [Frigoribacterium sp. RIT-PI-h]